MINLIKCKLFELKIYIYIYIYLSIFFTSWNSLNVLKYKNNNSIAFIKNILKLANMHFTF